MFRFALPAVLALSTALAAPTAQAGSISLGWSPANQQEAVGLQTAFTIYQIAKAAKSKGEIKQSGSGLAAALRQIGRGHVALIDQKGRNHSAGITQSGAPNAMAVIQRGKGASADVSQYGGQAGLLLQYGW